MLQEPQLLQSRGEKNQVRLKVGRYGRCFSWEWWKQQNWKGESTKVTKKDYTTSGQCTVKQHQWHRSLLWALKMALGKLQKYFCYFAWPVYIAVTQQLQLPFCCMIVYSNIKPPCKLKKVNYNMLTSRIMEQHSSKTGMTFTNRNTGTLAFFCSTVLKS